MGRGVVGLAIKNRACRVRKGLRRVSMSLLGANTCEACVGRSVASVWPVMRF